MASCSVTWVTLPHLYIDRRVWVPKADKFPLLRYIVAAGAVAALATTLMGALLPQVCQYSDLPIWDSHKSCLGTLVENIRRHHVCHGLVFIFINFICHLSYSSIGGQPRILMAMARDGLLPPFFSTIHPKTFVPVNGTVLTGCSATLMALILDVDQLSGLVSVLCLRNSLYILTQDWSESRLIQSRCDWTLFDDWGIQESHVIRKSRKELFLLILYSC